MTTESGTELETPVKISRMFFTASTSTGKPPISITMPVITTEDFSHHPVTRTTQSIIAKLSSSSVPVKLN